MTWIAFAALVAALGPAGLRWLRVAQREHYLAGACVRFARRWWFGRPDNLTLLATAVIALVLSSWWPLVALVVAAVIVLGPRGLSIRGRTSSLAATRRLRTVAAVWLACQAAVLVVGLVAGAPVVAAAIGALLVPAGVDAALLFTAPYERRAAFRFVAAAQTRLQAVHPTVVAVTGSYGKTSTKNHIAHLVAGTKVVVATPASFNNRAGLARAVNENLLPGTQVFVAEMGTYGQGEIAELCRWCPPEISVITAIGPVHLERFGSEDRIVQAKSEIARGANVVVLNIDDQRLAGLADDLEAAGARVARVSSRSSAADVTVQLHDRRVTVAVGDQKVEGDLENATGVRPTNLACAIAVALELGVGLHEIGQRLGNLSAVAHRLTTGTAGSGVVVLDDTYNSNPAGASSALEGLAQLPVARRRTVVTPGMVELGARQAQENVRFATAAAAVATDLVVVGRTNRRALMRGWSAVAGHGSLELIDTREKAVEWVRANLGPGDAVLYENDLPDHYP